MFLDKINLFNFMNFFKKPEVIFILIIAVVALGVYTYRAIVKKPAYDFVVAKKGTIIQEVSVTGRVKAAESVDLAFEKSGKVGAVYVKIGSKIFAGQRLAALSNGELAADLSKAKANLEAEKAVLAEMKKGTRPEEITIAETDLANAKSKADAVLKEAYDAALTAAGEAAVKGKNALLTLTDLQFKYFASNDQDSVTIVNAKKIAAKAMLGADNAGMMATEDISRLDGGAYGAVQDAIADPTDENIDEALLQISGALQKVKNALDTIKVTTSFTATEKTNLSTEKTTIGAEISTISAEKQTIAVQKTTNTNNIAAAEAALALKKAGSTPEEIAAEEAKVKSLEASVASAKAALDKTVIISPIGGIVSKQDVKAGEMATANTRVISIISDKKFEIEANVPEADIAKIVIGDEAKITLDAYGSNVIFEAKVIKIDPAETIIEGVATYKITLQFIKDDERVKSGMTANIDILTAKKDDVIVIPTRAVSTKDGEKMAQILVGEEIKEVMIKTGLRGSDGNIEIISGVSEGDKIVTGIKK